jgi:hypothetical protein
MSTVMVTASWPKAYEQLYKDTHTYTLSLSFSLSFSTPVLCLAGMNHGPNFEETDMNSHLDPLSH